MRVVVEVMREVDDNERLGLDTEAVKKKVPGVVVGR